MTDSQTIYPKEHNCSDSVLRKLTTENSYIAGTQSINQSVSPSVSQSAGQSVNQSILV